MSAPDYAWLDRIVEEQARINGPIVAKLIADAAEATGRLFPEELDELERRLHVTDHSQTYYYTARETDDGWVWRVYHYDPSGNQEIVVARGERGLDGQGLALDAAGDWCDEHNVDAELA